MSEEKDQFYFQGKFFDTSDEMFKYEKDWAEMPLDQESADRIIKSLIKDIVLNISLCGIPFKNKEFSDYIQEIFLFSMKKLEKER